MNEQEEHRECAVQAVADIIIKMLDDHEDSQEKWASRIIDELQEEHGYTRLAADEVVCKREMLTEAAKYMESAADYIPGDFPARTAVTNRALELRAKAGEGAMATDTNRRWCSACNAYVRRDKCVHWDHDSAKESA